MREKGGRGIQGRQIQQRVKEQTRILLGFRWTPSTLKHPHQNKIKEKKHCILWYNVLQSAPQHRIRKRSWSQSWLLTLLRKVHGPKYTHYKHPWIFYQPIFSCPTTICSNAFVYSQITIQSTLAGPVRHTNPRPHPP